MPGLDSHSTRALVTGCAGFIGSTLTDALLAAGTTVVGVDAVTDSYAPAAKRANLTGARAHDGFTFVEADLDALDPDRLLDGVSVVFHLAALPGVRASWGPQFAEYERSNVLVTQRLLEACRGAAIERFVYSSSSSVYGNAERFPVLESDLPRPLSPYGVTKLAAEHLCALYAGNFGVPCVSLRYFTVYGPRQRPDMAIYRIIDAALNGTEFQVFGSGEQRRDFTFVHDVVSANLLAANADVAPGTVLNVGGGSSTSLNEVIALVEQSAGQAVLLRHTDVAAGDPARTGSDTTLARGLLGWAPRTPVAEGVAAQVAWHRSQLGR